MSGMGIEKFGGDFAARLREMGPGSQTPLMDKGQAPQGGKSFIDHLSDSVREGNTMQKSADRMGTDLATGKAENIHEVMIASSEAGLAFNLMVQVRNKMLEAYQEVMRMPV
jgi:flagellar hook-basal body complex protein FliE